MSNHKEHKRTSLVFVIATIFVSFVFFAPPERSAAAETMTRAECVAANGTVRAVDPAQTPNGSGVICDLGNDFWLPISDPPPKSFEAIDPDFGCSITSWNGLKGCAAGFAYMIMTLFAITLGIAGILFNGAVELTIMKMSIFVKDVPAIDTTWGLIRDLMNIVILFLLLFSAIGTIFRSNKIVPKNILVEIVIAAILINFSMFFTKAIIDVSNVFTNSIYQEIRKVSDANNTDTTNPVQLMGISGALMKNLNPQKIYSDISASAKSSKDYETHIFQQMIFGIIVILVTTFVLFVAAVMLLVRFGVLLMLIVLSPIGIVGKLIPKMKVHSDHWWSTLLGQAFFAPVFMLFLYIAIIIINSDGFSASVSVAETNLAPDSAAAQAFAFLGGSTGGVSTAITYFLIIFFITFALTIAKQISGGVGAGAVKWAEKVGGKLAYGIPKAAGGTVARATVAGGAATIGKRYDNLLAKIPTETYRKIDRSTLGMFGAADRAAREGIKSGEKVKFGTKQTLAEVERARRDQQKELGSIATLETGKKAVEEVFTTNDKTKLAFDSANPAIENYLKSVKGLTNEQLEEMFNKDPELLKKEHFAIGLSQKQIDFIKDSKLLTQKDKDDIVGARETGGIRRIDLAPDTWVEGAKVAAGKPADIANLPKALLKKKEVAAALNVGTLKHIMDNETLNRADRDKVKQGIEYRWNELANRATTPGGAPLSDDENAELQRLEKTIKWFEHPDQKITW